MKVKILREQKEIQISYQNNATLLQNLIEQKLMIPAVCAGNGSCGKCKVRFLEGGMEPTTEEKNKLTEEELQQGIRLACKCRVQEGALILLTEKADTNMEILTTYEIKQAEETEEYKGTYGVAIDIGTTTIVMQLIDLFTAKPIKTYTAINSQTQYGADVITRIKESNEGKKNLLQTAVTEDLEKGLAVLQQDLETKIEKVVIAANTTMIHLLMGYSCETLGRFPFTPVTLSTIETNAQELLGNFPYPLPITIVPGISAFVGADIAMGLFACGFEEREAPVLFLDLGTNGEMAIGTREQIFVASTAAGPAFEGGNICYGTGSIQGAICHVEVEGTEITLSTIGEAEPIGICGTGVMEVVYELLKNGYANETGLFIDPYFEEGFTLTKTVGEASIGLEQKDMREIQLAKAAIRAGMETLLDKCSLQWKDISTLYLAGGFGYHLNLKKAVGIGLLPEELLSRTVAVGNTSLLGAVLCLTRKTAMKQVERIIAQSKEMILSNEEVFEKRYIECMNFE